MILFWFSILKNSAKILNFIHFQFSVSFDFEHKYRKKKLKLFNFKLVELTTMLSYVLKKHKFLIYSEENDLIFKHFFIFQNNF